MKHVTDYRNLSIYSIFPRNFSGEGTFQAILPQLDRIRDMGFEAIWLMPIHPIGELNRKGTMGSPYAIKDYYAIDPAYGTEEDFRELVRAAHTAGLKVLNDIVFHHTAWDSVLMQEHPEWFYHKADGSIGNKVGDWSDIADLDFSNAGLREYLMGALAYLAGFGIDGFRCDVAPLVPIDFWVQAREYLEERGFDLIWLSETIEPDFIRQIRRMCHRAHSDGEMYEAFDILYDYDLYPELKAFLSGELPMAEYLKGYSRQEWILPAHFVKLRFAENHDQVRLRALIPDPDRRINMTAFLMFLKGAWLFYNGQETTADHLPDLFEKDPVQWTYDEAMIELQRNFNRIKKMDFMRDGFFEIEAVSDQIAGITYDWEDEQITGLFWIGRGPLLEVPELPRGSKMIYEGGLTQPHNNFQLPIVYSQKK